MKFILPIIIIIHLLAINCGANDSAQQNHFYPGEKLTYWGRWGIIPAGYVTLEVLPNEIIDGVETYHFALTAKTNSVVDFIYKIRERHDSYIDMQTTHTIQYKKRTESKYPSDIKLNFDWDKLEATRSDFGKMTSQIHVLPGSFDPLAIVYILRLQALKENSVIEIPVTDGKKNIMFSATITKKALVIIGEKTYETFEISPDMKNLEQLVKKDANPTFKIWITSDGQCIPVKIQSSVGIVSFIFELASIEP
ncbi:MAG: hypothetical protein A2511_18005 [Deltaproteobacteria bacterium RIFOXYD12_FULL_50_9]|nr:MAG: hypothetical protein A2511_18005 [Deltaproteobacteria bacterium RIFOXYD12_FULL_50_9]